MRLTLTRLLERRARNERGSTLIFALVMITVVAVAGATVLTQVSNAPTAQVAYKDLRTVEIGADNVANNLVHGMRLDPLAAVAASQGGTGMCNNDTSIGSPVLANAALKDGSGQPVKANDGSNINVDVYCQADPQSAALKGTAPNAPGTSILTLGGMQPKALPYLSNGNLVSNPATVYGSDYCASNCAGPNKLPTAWATYCNDYHDYQNAAGSADRCEAGVFIGRGVAEASSTPTDACTTPPCPGGMVVGSTGSLGATGPLLQSNSSVIVSQIAGVSRELDVEGSIWARAACGYGAGGNSSGFLTSVYAGYDPVKFPTGDATKLHCYNKYANQNPWASPSGPALTGGQNMGNEPLLPDPDYVHEPLDLKQVPLINEFTPYGGQDTCKYGVATSTVVAPPLSRVPCSSKSCWDPGTGTNTASCQLNGSDATRGCANGFMIMPAKKLIGYQQHAVVDGHAEDHDVYVGWYDSANALNTLMSNCPDTFFWFRPGIYYFDFQDVAGTLSQGGPAATQWNSAKGCFPLTACGSPLDELIGGTAPGWYPGYDTSTTDKVNQLGWNPCGVQVGGRFEFSGTKAAIQNCLQPETELVPENTTLLGTSHFVNPAAAVEIDDKASTTRLWNGTPTNLTDGITWGALQTPIPQNIANNSVQNITGISTFNFEVAYNLPGNQADLNTMAGGGTVPQSEYNKYYVDDTGSDDYPNATKHGAEIQFQISGTNGGKCYVYVPPGAHGALDAFGPTLGNTIKINLLDGCNPLKIDPWGQGLQVDHVGGGFPCGTAADWNALHISSGKPIPGCTTNAITDFRQSPDMIDLMKATFYVKTATNVSNDINAGLAVVNGAKFHVQWTGRPAPQYPGGCDRARPGVQFIFGGSGYINWGSSGTHSMFSELCASRQDTFPNWADPFGWCAGYPNSTDPRCYKTGPGHDYGIAIYGTAPDGAAPPGKLDTTDTIATGGTFAYQAADSTTGSGTGGPPWTDTTGVNAGRSTIYGDVPPNTSSLMAAVDPAAPRTNPISTVFTDSLWSNATLAFKLPGDLTSTLVGNGPNQIPQGALINQVRIEVYHREGTVIDNGGCGYQPLSNASWSSGNNGTLTYTTAQPHGLHVGDLVNIVGFSPAVYNQGYATVAAVTPTTFTIYNGGSNQGAPSVLGKIVKPLPANVLGTPGCQLNNNSGDIKSLRLKIASNIGQAYAGNAYSGGTWDSNANGTRVNNGDGVPICGSSYNSGGAFSSRVDWAKGKNTSTGAVDSGCPFTWGNINSVMDNADSTGEDWSYQRDLTDTINSVEDLNNAEVVWSATVAKNNNIRQLDLLGFRVFVTYRGVASQGGNAAAVSFGPRPIRGCNTTRTAWPNGYLVPSDATTGVKGIAQAARGYDWLDPDWGTQKWASAAAPMSTDDAYGNDSANPGGTGNKGDPQDCALLKIDNGSGSRIKFHVSGAIYTPSAALALTANDNDSEWATDGIVARQLSALRWKNNGDIPAVGNDPQPRQDRRFTIYVCKTGTGCTSPKDIYLKTTMSIDDEKRQNPGHAINTLSWARCFLPEVVCTAP